MDDKKEQIKVITFDLLAESFNHMVEKIDKAIASGALDIDSFDPKKDRYIIPNIIARAILEDEVSTYEFKGTRYEKIIRKQVKNLKLFL